MKTLQTESLQTAILKAASLKTKLWHVILVSLMLSLAACAPITPAPTGSGTPATEQATEEATEEATAAPGEEPTAVATEEAPEEATTVPAEEPTAEAAGEEGDMGALVRQILAQQLQLDLNQIEIVSVEAVDWPDACLGVYTADMMCAQVITPGYRVVLEVDGEQYEYHTNLDGSFVQLFAAPAATIGDALITWEQTLDTCQAAQIGTEGVIFGPCMGVQMGGKLVVPERTAELSDLVATFAPFSAETVAGMVTFNGQGSTEATPAEQRMIAEWARQVALEAQAGRSGASWGLAFAWHREGGLAGFCDDLTAYVNGQLYAASCKSGAAENLGQRRLTAAELEQLYSWIDEYASFEYVQDDGDVDDAMKVTLIFSGAGSTPADEEAQLAIYAFAADIYAAMGQ